MRIPKIWINFSIINLCIVAVLGFLLRSKQLFEMPFIDYNHLVNGRFAFGGWVTLSLLCLLIYELLPLSSASKALYQWLLVGTFTFSLAILISLTIQGNGPVTNIISSLFILISCAFSFQLGRDILKANLHKSVRLLAISSLCCLVLSSAGSISLAVLFSVQSLNAIYYRDAMYTYLHLQYNGFFTLAVFALLFHKLIPKVTVSSQKHIYRFSILLTMSVLPSLFLSYLWHNPNMIFWIIASVGSILVFLSFTWFVILGFSIGYIRKTFSPVVRYLGVLSMLAFALKEFLQGFTLFPSINNAVFGSRPTVIGFLHLVFLGLVTQFILAWYAQYGVLDKRIKFTNLAIIYFSIGVILNEAILMVQGLGSMFIIGYAIFSWLLWAASIWLLSGAFMIGVARMLRTRDNLAI